MSRVRLGKHGRDHRPDGHDPVHGPRIYIGTAGVDGVDAKLAANPHPYATGDTPGPSPFLNGVTNAFLLDINGNPGDGLWYRWVPHGIQVDFGGGITVPFSIPFAFATLVGVPFPDSSKPAVDGLLDGSGLFQWQLVVPGSAGAGSGDLVFLDSLVGVDGGGP